MGRRAGSKDYSFETKLKAVKMILEEGMTLEQVKEALGIIDKSRIQRWLTAYHKEGELALQNKRIGITRKPDDQQAYIKRLEMENDLLKKLHLELGRCMPEKPDIE